MSWLPELVSWSPEPGGPLALILHGTGSNPDFVRRTFFKAAEHRGYSLCTYRLRGHGPQPGPRPYDLHAHIDDLDRIVRSVKPLVVGGISLGAHISSQWAAAANPTSLEGLCFAIPAWIGAPDAVAAANATQADAIARDGVEQCLTALESDLEQTPTAWVAAEMRATWPEHEESAFIEVLSQVAISEGPSRAELASIRGPVGIAAVTGDPLHPASVAHLWAQALPQATVTEISLQDFGEDRSALGAAAFSGFPLSRDHAQRA